jgi:xanthosine utilization system XapX-like protein
MQKFIRKYKTYIIGITLGALAGFIYWRFVGCTSGSCPITSHWFNTMLYGGIMGALLSGTGRKKEKVNPEEEKQIE